jgi:hypothetical protein
MGVWRARYKDLSLGWDSPVKRPVHPRHVNLAARGGLGWLDGFNELLCRCGLASNGPPGDDAGAKSPVESQLTLHGRIANTPAHRVEVHVDDAGAGTISVSGVVDETTMFGPQLRLETTIATEAGSNAFTISDKVTNLGSSDAELELLYHANFGRPFLEAGATVHCPARVVAPRNARAAEGIAAYNTYLGPTPGYAEQVYFYDLLADDQGQTLALLTNAHGRLGVSLHFSRKQLPCFTVWKCTQADADGYVTGLEPGTNFPNIKPYERDQGRVINLAAGATHEASLRIEVHDSAESVAKIEQRIAALQGGTEPMIHSRPMAPFSPEE